MKVGLYGGAFNPIHRCHLVVAEAVQQRLGLDRVLFIPAGAPPHKSPAELLPVSHRLEMVRLATAPYPFFDLSDIEIRRSSTSYSIDTVLEIQASYPTNTTLIFITGLDAFLELPTWKNPERLLAACDFAVVSRPGYRFTSLAGLSCLANPDLGLLEQLDTSRLETQALRLHSGRTLWGVSIPPCEVSAQAIRQRLQQKQSLENLLPPCVESYILKRIPIR